MVNREVYLSVLTSCVRHESTASMGRMSAVKKKLLSRRTVARAGRLLDEGLVSNHY